MDLEIKRLYKNSINRKTLDIEYKFIEKNEKLIIKIKNEIKTLNLINYNKFKSIKKFENILKEEFLDDNILYLYISIFIVKSFDYGLDDLRQKKYRTIYDNINSMNKSIQNLNIFIRQNKLEEEFIDEKVCSKFFLKLISFLISKKIIEKVIHFDKKERKKTMVILLKDLIQAPHVEIYQDEFKLLPFSGEFYLISKTFNSIRKVSLVNIENNPFKTGDKEFLGNLLSKKMYLDHDLLQIINTEYKKKNQIDSVNVSEEYSRILNQHAKFIKEDDENGVVESSKLISIFQKVLLFEFLLKNKIEYCFAPIIIDFRGRVYKGSSFSVTFVKELRICIYFGYYDEEFIKKYKEGKTDRILDKYIHLLDEIRVEINIHKIIKRSILWYLIALAENIKSQLGKEINIETLIKEGIKIYKNKEINFEYDKKIKIIAYIKGIDMLLSKNTIRKSPISKDATASVYQQLIKILGAKDSNVYKKANLNSENTLYDIYTFIIEEWYIKREEKIKEVQLENISKYFNRKNLKKVMMTKNYGCGFIRCMKYFIEDIEKDEILEEKEREKIGKLIHSFYHFITNEVSLTKVGVKEIDKFLEKTEYKIIKLEDGSMVDLRYFKKEKKRLDTKTKGERHTSIITFPSDQLNLDKMRIAGPANYTHMQDGAMARDVSSEIECLIIHDCFIVGCLEVSTLVDIVNRSMNKKYHVIFQTENVYIYSIFIVV